LVAPPGATGAGESSLPVVNAGVPPAVLPATLVSVTEARTSIMWPHLRHFMRTVFPATLSSEIWYFALHWSQRNFT
jgi:hypothetical protein